MTHTVFVIIFGFLLLPGILMALVPMLPAFWYLLAVAVLFGAIDGFVHLTIQNLAVLGALFGASILVDWSAGLLGAKLGGAAWRSLLYGMAGGIVGLLIFPPFGVFAGLFFGVLLGELLRQRSRTEAARAAGGALLGSLAGVILNAFLASSFIALFVVFAAK